MQDLKPIGPMDPIKPRDVSSEPVKPDLVPRPEPPGSGIAGPPFYGRAWFAYVMGTIITAGGALWAYDLTHYIGVGIIALCGGYMAWAGIDKVRKSSWIDAVIEAIRAALNALEKWIKKRTK